MLRAAGLIAILGMTSLVSSTAHADAGSKARKVGELLTAMHLEETTNRLEQAEEPGWTP